MRFRLTAALGLWLALSACTTPYGQQGLMGGYTEERLGETRYRVKFQGNGNTSEERVWAFWMHRCAELSKEKGYTHFSLSRSGAQTAWAPEVHDLPSVPRHAGMRTAALHTDAAPGGLLKTKGGGAPVYIYTPGYTITSYRTDAELELHRAPLPEGVAMLKAQTVLDELGAYVKSDGKAPMPARRELIDKAATYIPVQRGYTFGGYF